jgi:SAM-dependent methyltransferase
VDPYQRVAAFYDCEHADFDDDIGFYLHALQPGTVLEIGTGTGRIARAVAGGGYQVRAIDPSEAMLSRARAGGSPQTNLVFAPGGLPQLELDEEFDNIILSLNTLWHVDTATGQLQALRAVQRALVPGGLLFLDLTNPLSMADRGADGQIRERFRGSCEAMTLVVQSAAWDDEAHQMLSLHLTFDRLSGDGGIERTLTELSLRYLYRSELELMLAAAGLHLRAVFGSYDMEPYQTGSTNLLVVATRP